MADDVPDMTAVELAQKLDQAVAAYQRYHGRPQTVAKLMHIVEAKVRAAAYAEGTDPNTLARSAAE